MSTPPPSRRLTLGANVMRFGDEIKIRARSSYMRDRSTKEWPAGYEGGFLGVYEKRGRAPRVVLPPLGPKASGTLTEAVYRIEDPRENYPGSSHGKAVRYCDWCVLIDQSGFVWNNKSGGFFEGHLGPRPRGSAGEMYISFQRAGMEHNGVEYGAEGICIDVEDSHRYRVGYNQRLSNYKAATSKIQGGYVVSDGSGEPLEVTLFRASAGGASPEQQVGAVVLCVSVARKGARPGAEEDVMMVTPKYGAGVVVFGVRSKDEIRIHLSSGGCAVLSCSQLEARKHAQVQVLHETDTAVAVGSLELSWKRTWNAQTVEGGDEEGGETRPSSLKEAALPLLKAFFLFVAVYFVAFVALSRALKATEQGIKPLWSALLICWGLGLLSPPEARNPIPALEKKDGNKDTPGKYGAESHDGGSDGKGDDDEEEPGDWVLTVSLSSEVRHHSSLERANTRSIIVTGTWEIPGVDANGVPKHPAFRRFLDGEQGNLETALKRWKITTDWRRERGVDTILERPHKHFDVIKANYPHFYFRRGKKGHPVYIERPGGVNMKALRKAGVKLKDLLWHYLFSAEYLWSRLEPSERAMTITILDLNGIGLFDFAGEVVDFVKKSSAFIQEHYPERSYQIFVINVPRWFSTLWAAVKPLVNERTREKMHIHRDNYQEELLKHVAAEDLPREYGGTCDQPLSESKEEVLLRNLVYRNNMREEMPITGANGRPVPGSPENLETKIDATIIEDEVWAKYDVINGFGPQQVPERPGVEEDAEQTPATKDIKEGNAPADAARA